MYKMKKEEMKEVSAGKNKKMAPATKAPMKKGGMPMVMQDGKKIPLFAVKKGKK